MLGRSYGSRLEADLPRWAAAGWVSDDGVKAILAEVREQEASTSGPNRLISILSVLGAILIGAGVLSFVAANWQDMPRLFRLGLLVTCIWASYGAAAATFRRGLDAFAHALVLLGSVIFGASIMLVAQMYHMNGNPPDAVLLWMAGSLLAGVVMNSNPTIVFSLLLTCLWGAWETQETYGVYWPFLLVWALPTIALVWRDCRYGVKLAAIAIGAWIVSLGYLLPDYPNHLLVLIIGLVIAAGGFALSKTPQLEERHGRLLLALGYAIAFAALFGAQFLTAHISFAALVILAVLALLMSVAAIWWGLKTHDATLHRIAYAAFAVEVIGIYIKTIGTLMGTSVFFFSAGLGVVALAVAAFWVDRRLRKMIGETP